MRLIDADNLRKDIENLCPEFGNENSSLVEQGEVLDFIEEQPTVDAVEVVRCRDCKNLIAFEDGHLSCGFKPFDGGVSAMDYCSRGVRRRR